MARPISPWDPPPDFFHNDLVWMTRLDGRYQIEVQRTGARTGNLLIFDHGDGDKELACFPVGLSYGAIFGPDVADVAEWQEKVIDFIDNRKP